MLLLKLIYSLKLSVMCICKKMMFKNSLTFKHSLNINDQF